MHVDPIATYRLQLSSAFTFDDAAAIVGYLAALGVSHVYCSPILQACAGSEHGYDVVDPGRVNEELGGNGGFERLAKAVRASELRLLLDIVPNHMAVSCENRWWRDVLQHGPVSPYATFFDVDTAASSDGRILLPTLGDHIGHVLERGELQLHVREGGAPVFRYAEHEFPLNVSTATELLEGVPPGSSLEAVVGELNADPARLEALHARQHYRLAYWKMATEELGYRRFFDVTTLIGLRVEDEAVFAASHELILRLVGDGVVEGLRVDHPDGLRDPEDYLQRLREAAPEAWILVEKIVEPGETLRGSWPVDGMTGYDFLNQVGGLFVDPGGEAAMTRIYQDFTGRSNDYHAMVHEKKLFVLTNVLGSDVNRLGGLLQRICERHPTHRDYTRRSLTEVIREVAAAMPVYRTYARERPRQVTGEDEQRVRQAIELARRHRADLEPELLDFMADLLLLRIDGEFESDFAMRFQQLTGPAMAKGVEDTTFYCYNRLVSLNEVGGDPGRFGVSPDSFHRFCTAMQQDWPRTLLATATHDTKRSGDVRTRISVLTECPERWAAAVCRWAEMNARHRRDGLPDRNAEYLLYQILVGAWPIELDRVLAYMQKAAREAKEHTSWLRPSEDYEQALQDYVRGILGDSEFVADLGAFAATITDAGRINGLAQTLVKMTAPGVPDIYQGTETWSLTLVDPDNRRPVDYAALRRMLAELDAATPEQVLARNDEGLPKLWVVRQALALRRRRPQAFGPDGAYRPVHARGSKAAHLMAYLRGEIVVTLVPRLSLRLGGDWGDTAFDLPQGTWINVMTGEHWAGGEARLAELLRRFPVALLAREMRS